MLKYILYFLGLELPEGGSVSVEFGFNVAIICLIILICFINVFGYFIALYFFDNSDLQKEYPKLSVFIKYLKKSSFIIIIFDGFLGFTFLIILICLGFYPLFRLQ